jgi:molybdate transport system substrate-binding protein
MTGYPPQPPRPVLALPLGRVRRIALLVLLALAASLALPPAGRAETPARVTVFAAASLKNAMDRIAAEWRDRTGGELVVSLAGSSALARQIQAGAPADIFISASTDWMDLLEGEGLLRDGTRRDLLGNSIVLVAHGGDAPPVTLSPGLDLAGLIGGEKLAMALVDAVPAGVYGKAALTSLGLWDSVAGKVAQTDNVRAALALVATGEARFGIVYATDAAAEPSVRVVGTFPADTHPPIVYPAAVLAESGNPSAGDVLAFLGGAEAKSVFAGEGFVVLD